jgi:nicotinamide mononucleotide (NMN) deamidase PncC
MIILGLVAVAAVGTAPPSGGTTDTQAGLAFAGGLLGTIGDVVTDII